MPLVEITLWPGRSEEVKERIIREVTDALSRSCGAPPDAIEIIIRDVPKTDWGRGGRPFSKSSP
ncbi:MAG: 4-oxalocrotonate tautomerase family protein [Candidatus Eisenbacteria bacterium]|nr:4-oxalocrotonate tautomerase family protein [Candidatus Eisenbacteria bacterium]